MGFLSAEMTWGPIRMATIKQPETVETPISKVRPFPRRLYHLNREGDPDTRDDGTQGRRRGPACGQTGFHSKPQLCCLLLCDRGKSSTSLCLFFPCLQMNIVIHTSKGCKNTA